MMKSTIKIIVAMLAICLCLSLFACGEDSCTHASIGDDGKCTECGEQINEPSPGLELKDGEIALVEAGVTKFQFVIGSNVSADVRMKIEELAESFNECVAKDAAVSVVNDSASTAAQGLCEIMFGKITSRGDAYKTDGYYLGYSGYAIKRADGNIVVHAGSDDAFEKAIKVLKNDVFDLKHYDEDEPIVNLVFSEDISKPETDFAVTSFTISGRDLSEHVIAYEKGNKDAERLAKEIRTSYYRTVGKYLEIVRLDKLVEGQAAIMLTTVGNDGESDGFEVRADEVGLHVECQYPEKLYENAYDYLIGIIEKGGKVKLDEGVLKTVNLRDIYYSDFGARGDGYTDDFKAIKAAHDYANLWGHRVNANEGATYYIGKESGGDTIEIMTDTVWGDASFVIDDSEIAGHSYDGCTDCLIRNAHVFEIKPENPRLWYSVYPEGSASISNEAANDAFLAINAAGGIKASEFTKLDLGLGYPAIVYLQDSDHKQYIRYSGEDGMNNNDGGAQFELVVIDAEGNIDEKTPLLFDYAQVTGYGIARIDDEQITVTGGTFTTIANQAPIAYNAYSRGISIKRSNTILEGLTHHVTGEGATGAPYGGFISVNEANNVLIKDCVVSAHKHYNNNGTYDLGAYGSNNVTWYNVTMTNFYGTVTSGTSDTEYQVPSVKADLWGVMGSNYCKNLTYDTCQLTRFDAHCGVYNATIKNSTVSAIELIGGGTFTLENSVVETGFSSYLIDFRPDYGSTWHGDIIIKNVTFKKHTILSQTTLYLIQAQWYNHDYGYECYMPTSITVEGLRAETLSGPAVTHFSIATGDITRSDILNETVNGASGAVENKNLIHTTERLTISGVEGLKFIRGDAVAFADVEITVEGKPYEEE